MPVDVVGSGRAVAPTAATVLAQVAANAIPTGGSGNFEIVVHCAVSNAAAADEGNLKLVVNNADLSNPLPCGVNGADVSSTFDEHLDGTHPVQVVVVGNATAAIEYQATIELRRKD